MDEEKFNRTIRKFLKEIGIPGSTRSKQLCEKRYGRPSARKRETRSNNDIGDWHHPAYHVVNGEIELT